MLNLVISVMMSMVTTTLMTSVAPPPFPLVDLLGCDGRIGGRIVRGGKMVLGRVVLHRFVHRRIVRQGRVGGIGRVAGIGRVDRGRADGMA